ncbi:MAG: hypothetical protein HQK75_19235 [Candidatus Magnetomorum sp.]|nr:hypothetical protein [Candidatus Magnetomorum sp.]
MDNQASLPKGHDNFKFPFEELFNDKIIERMDQNQDIFNRLMEGGDFAKAISNAIMHEVYRRLKDQDTPIKQMGSNLEL